jgi:osmotically-inducible protein OsmY
MLAFKKWEVYMSKLILKSLGVATALLFLSACVSGPLLLAGAATGGAVNVAGSSNSVPSQTTDMEIKSELYTILNNEPSLNGADVEVTVFNGIVLLLGQVPTAPIKSDITTKASQIKSVVIVYDQMTVGPNVTFSEFANDGWITSKVKGNMMGIVNPLLFKVVTQDKVVYLMGQVTLQEGDQAAAIASETSGVQKVVKIFNYVTPPSTAVPTTMTPSKAASPTSSTQPEALTTGSAPGPASLTPVGSAASD